MCSSLIRAGGTQANMLVEYLKDVSAMLCLIMAVREKSIETHLAAERTLLSKCQLCQISDVPACQLTKSENKSKRPLEWPRAKRIQRFTVWQSILYNSSDLITETTFNREVKVGEVLCKVDTQQVWRQHMPSLRQAIWERSGSMVRRRIPDRKLPGSISTWTTLISQLVWHGQSGRLVAAPWFHWKVSES